MLQLYIAPTWLVAIEQNAASVLFVLAALFMLGGSFKALGEKHVKRLLMSLGVVGAGVLCISIGVMLATEHIQPIQYFSFYLLAYVLMMVGSLTVGMIVSSAVGHQELRGFAGLYYRAPWMSVAMTLLLLSMAGIPISGGFFGKLFIMLSTASIGLYWLLAILVLSTIIVYYVCFTFIVQMFMRSAGAMKPNVKMVSKLDQEGRIRLSVTSSAVIWFCAIGSLLLGIFPGVFIHYIELLIRM